MVEAKFNGATPKLVVEPYAIRLGRGVFLIKTLSTMLRCDLHLHVHLHLASQMCIYMCFTCAFTCTFQLYVHFFLHGPFLVPCAGSGLLHFYHHAAVAKGEGKLSRLFSFSGNQSKITFFFLSSQLLLRPKRTSFFYLMPFSDSPRLGLLKHTRRYITLLMTLRHLRHILR